MPMTSPGVGRARNGESLLLSDVPHSPIGGFRESVVASVGAGARISALFGRRVVGGVRLHAVLAHADRGLLSLLSTDVRDAYPSMTNDCAQAHLFEREIAERLGVTPNGHPWLKPVRYIANDGETLPCDVRFFEVRGDEVHEVAVGPVHAGVIEPGHFRFQCHGEKVLHLEISLGYQHRGVARALVGGPTKRTIHAVETLAGDTSIGHAIAYAEIVESLASARVPARAQALRAVALELERLANHVGDLGALANDVGYLPTASYCGRLRGDFLNLTALLCGSRFGRGMVRPGGVGFDVDDARVVEFVSRMDAAVRDVKIAANLLWESPSVQARFEDTGTVSRDAALELGLVGVAARACGLERDVREEFPSGIYRFSHIPMSTWHTGDVNARALVRWLEIQRSAEFVRSTIEALPSGASRVEVATLAPGRIVAALVEGWRGEICHVAITDDRGRLAAYEVVDPSFHNWTGLAMALRGQPISDFPLCNKSFNLSYCGHDL